jgi:TRAP-type transport system periplasmic protein
MTHHPCFLRMVSAAAVAGALLSVAAPAPAADYTARLSLDVREDNPKYMAAKTFADLAAEKTEGAVEIQLFPNSLLGGEVETAEGMRLGSVQMAILTSSVLSQWVPQIQVLDLPFIFENDAHAVAINAPLTEAMEVNFEDSGFHLLGFTPNGARSIISKTAISTPEDASGKKMRVIQNPLHVALWEAVGANPVPIPAPEIYNSMQTGVVDFFDNTASNYFTSKFYEVAPFYTKLNHIYAMGTWVVSSAWWDGLPEEFQTALTEAAAEAQAAYVPAWQAADAAALAETEAQGATIISDIDTAAWEEKMGPVREEFSAQIPDAGSLLEIIAAAKPAG